MQLSHASRSHMIIRRWLPPWLYPHITLFTMLQETVDARWQHSAALLCFYVCMYFPCETSCKIYDRGTNQQIALDEADSFRCVSRFPTVGLNSHTTVRCEILNLALRSERLFLGGSAAEGGSSIQVSVKRCCFILLFHTQDWLTARNQQLSLGNPHLFPFLHLQTGGSCYLCRSGLSSSSSRIKKKKKREREIISHAGSVCGKTKVLRPLLPSWCMVQIRNDWKFCYAGTL